MPYTLILNRYSIPRENCLAPAKDQGIKLFLDALRIIRNLIANGSANPHIVTDTIIWSIQLSPDVPLGAEALALSRDDRAFILRLSTSTCADHFAEETVETILGRTVYLRGTRIEVLELGGAALSGDMLAVSFATSSTWAQESILLKWEEQTGGSDIPLPTSLKNLSTTTHAIALSEHYRSISPVNEAYWCSKIPESVLLYAFWRWYSALDILSQHDIFSRGDICRRSGWRARHLGTLQQLVNTNNGIFEIRCWGNNHVFRVFVKVESPKSVVFLGGMDKNDDQNSAIAKADALYSSYLTDKVKHIRACCH